jgi:hypothetical protein
VVYVNKNAAGALHDGKTWGTAFVAVQAGINAAANGDEVWVAAGSYSESISITTAVPLYGGFAGAEALRSQRDPKANAAVLDGGGLHPVVRIEGAGTVLDGFTIQNGLNNFQGVGGINCMAPNVVIANNLIRNNKYSDTYMGSGSGGGVYLSPQATGAIVRDNSITGNTVYAGAGVSTYAVGATAYGGGIAVYAGNVTVERNVITQNSVTGEGFKFGSCSHCFDPTGWAFGGGIAVLGSTCIVRDNLIAYNTATGNYTGQGGGLDASGATGASLIANNTFVGNTSAGATVIVAGAGVYANNIVFGNSTGQSVQGVTQGHNAVFGNRTFDYAPTTSSSPTDIHLDPLFVNTTAGDYRLRSGSPCIDAGDDTVVVTGDTDLVGKPRIIGAHVDMGAYEFTAPAFGFPDVQRALSLAGGLEQRTSADQNLDVQTSAPSDGKIDILDVVRLARIAIGLE